MVCTRLVVGLVLSCLYCEERSIPVWKCPLWTASVHEAGEGMQHITGIVLALAWQPCVMNLEAGGFV